MTISPDLYRRILSTSTARPRSRSAREHQLQRMLSRIMSATVFDQESLKFPTLAPERVFIAKIRDYQRVTSSYYYDDKVRAAVKEKIPWERLSKAAAEKVRLLEDKCLGAKDLFLLELTEWFKNSFFSWFDTGTCNTPSCPQKGSAMQAIGSGQPSLEDLLWGGSRVELYQCLSCKNQVRFVRYNHPLKLLDTRSGRCGEWANTFTCICTVLGFETRLVLDWTDHVWTEVYSDSLNRWVHVDACEAAIDTPNVYESGWKKNLSYVVAVSRDQIQDVTWRYSLKEPNQLFLRRKDCQETWLVGFIYRMNCHFQSVLPQEKRDVLRERCARELVQLLWTPWKESEAKVTDMEGRQSGSEAWRRARNELGSLKEKQG